MTQNDFEFIIYESFDHLATPKTYFESKRKDCIPSEYRFGLFMAFEGLKSQLDLTDYNRVLLTMINGETFDYKLSDEKTHSEQLEFIINKGGETGKISFPYKLIFDLRQRTNGLFDGILKAAHIEILSSILDTYFAYLLTLEPDKKTSQPITLECMKENTEQMQRMGKLIEIFNKMDIDKPFEGSDFINVYRGDISLVRKPFIQDFNYDLCLKLYELKGEIEGLTDYAKIVHLDNIELNKPSNTHFDKEIKNGQLHANAFDQSEIDFYCFILAYKEYIKLQVTETPDRSTQQINKQNKPTADQIALLYYYQNKSITLDNVAEIAKSHGFKGRRLYNLFTSYLNNTDRKAAPTINTKITFRNKIELFRSVSEMLAPEYKPKAEAELTILTNLYNSQYQ